MSSWYLYIIQSEATGWFYTGISTRPEHRLQQHNGVLKGGSKATRGGRPWKLVYVEPCPNKSTALRREAAIKRLSRKAKLVLVERHRQFEDVGPLPTEIEDG